MGLAVGLAVALPAPAQAQQRHPFIQFACYPETGTFAIRQTVHHGPKAGDATALKEKYGFVNYEAANGQCVMGADTITWRYRPLKHNPLGRCGVPFWGGFISIAINDQPFLDDIGFGGLMGFCPGAALQYVAVSRNRDEPLELRMEGYWGGDLDRQETMPLNLPLTRDHLHEYFPTCHIFRGLPGQPPACKTLQRFFIAKAHKEGGYEINHLQNISRLGQ